MGSRSGKSSPKVSSMENNHKEPFIIGVAGGAASGKTTVCDIITQQLHGQQIIVLSQESFYYGLSEKKLSQVHGYNFDHPDAFDTERLLSCLKSLKCGNEANIPNYDFKTYEKVFPERKVSPSDVIILEGILVFHDPRLRELMNMTIFVDTDADVRLAQRIHRDTVEKGRAVTVVLEQYSKFVKPSFEDFIAPTKKYADIIIPWGRNNQVAIDLIVQHIQTKLGQHDICKFYSNLYVIQSTFQLVRSFVKRTKKLGPCWFMYEGLTGQYHFYSGTIRGMLTIIRDANTSKHDFIFYADRLIRLVVENGLGHLPFKEKQVKTPTGAVYTGVEFCREKLCGISVIRSGESMENALRACCKGIKIGKILIHKDAEEGEQLIYQHLPKDIAERHVLLLDPILATGNSAVQAISLLLERGVQESNIIFLNLISAPEGIHAVCKKFPRIRIITSEIELGLNEECHVIPGMGEFGDRYFGTV